MCNVLPSGAKARITFVMPESDVDIKFISFALISIIAPISIVCLFFRQIQTRIFCY